MKGSVFYGVSELHTRSHLLASFSPSLSAFLTVILCSKFTFLSAIYSYICDWVYHVSLIYHFLPWHISSSFSLLSHVFIPVSSFFYLKPNPSFLLYSHSFLSLRHILFFLFIAFYFYSFYLISFLFHSASFSSFFFFLSSFFLFFFITFIILSHTSASPIPVIYLSCSIFSHSDFLSVYFTNSVSVYFNVFKTVYFTRSFQYVTPS